MTPSSDYSAYFLGPKSENESWTRAEMQSILDHWFHWRKTLFPEDQPVISSGDRTSPEYLLARQRMAQGLEELNELLDAEIPKFTPRYIGHMVSELALPAILGHMAMLLHNPNNTSREASKIGSHIELEVIAMLAEMLGFDPKIATGHITGGGTMANFEAVWRARFRQDHWLSLMLFLAERHGKHLDLFKGAYMGWDQFNKLVQDYAVAPDELRHFSAVAANPYEFADRMNSAFGTKYRGPVMLVPENKHFSWSKAANIFGFGEEALWSIPLDKHGKSDVAALKHLLQRARDRQRPVTMLVSVAGTTETGEIDPIDQTQGIVDAALAEEGIDIWHHVDAAYGGYLCSLLRGNRSEVLSKATTRALSAIGEAHSITIDPHKLGYVPYACGAILTRNERCYAVSGFKAPYLERQLDAPDKWSTTIEGSRSAAGAAATWMTGKTLGFDGDGLGRVIADTIRATWRFKEKLGAALPFVQFLTPSETNILCFSVCEQGWTLSRANEATGALFRHFESCREFSVSKTTLAGAAHAKMIGRHVGSFSGTMDDDRLVLIRCVFMNPFWSDPETFRKLTEELIADLGDWFQEFTGEQAEA